MWKTDLKEEIGGVEDMRTLLQELGYFSNNVSEMWCGQ